jgi:pentatricopeptide repeat protein
MLNQAKREGYFPSKLPIVDMKPIHWAWSQDMFHSLIKACASAGSPKASWQYYREMKMYWKPNVDTFANLLLIVKRKEQLARHGLVRQSGSLYWCFIVMYSLFLQSAFDEMISVYGKNVHSLIKKWTFCIHLYHGCLQVELCSLVAQH